MYLSKSITNMCGIIEPIPYTQHSQICARAYPAIMAHPTSFRRRFKLQKLEWNGYSTALDKLIEDVEPIPEKYIGFVEKVCVAAIWYIPRGCRTNYIPGLSEESKSMYEDEKTVCKRPF